MGQVGVHHGGLRDLGSESLGSEGLRGVFNCKGLARLIIRGRGSKSY